MLNIEILTAGVLKAYMLEELHIVIYFLHKQAVLSDNLLRSSCHKTPISLGTQIVGMFVAYVCTEQIVMFVHDAK
jgi:hypothetical protein